MNHTTNTKSRRREVGEGCLIIGTRHPIHRDRLATGRIVTDNRWIGRASYGVRLEDGTGRIVELTEDRLI